MSTRLDRHRPDFVVIGAMKCATSSLHEQLAAQPGVFMSTPKEPNFFSDDAVYALGLPWYAGLFESAPTGAIRGESSTHYTKRPTHPDAVARMRAALDDVRLVYVMRDPIDRIRSQFVHEWTEGRCGRSFPGALESLPELLEYSRYAMQLRPWLEAYGSERVLPVFQERLRHDPSGEFERIARFLGLPAGSSWRDDLGDSNVSAERLRRSPMRDAIIDFPGAAWIRRTLVPQAVRDRLKSRWRMADRPEIDEAMFRRIADQLDPDIAEFGRWLGVPLDCSTWKQRVVTMDEPRWRPEGMSLERAA